MICPKCGKTVNEKSIVCMYCGKNINGSAMANNSVSELKEKEPEYQKDRIQKNASEKSLGGALMAIGGILDIVSMFMVGSGSVEAFSFCCIGGTICFFIGLFLVRGSNF